MDGSVKTRARRRARALRDLPLRRLARDRRSRARETRAATAGGLLMCCALACLSASWCGMVHSASAQAPVVGKSLEPLRAGSIIALLPAAATAGAGAGQRDIAVRAISEYLRSKGFRVLSPKDVQNKLSSHALEGCKNPATCDPALALATLAADAVISTAVWQRAAAPAQLVVHVRRQHGYGQAEIGTSDKELRATAVRALQTALDDSLHTHEIDVWIDSQPPGAIAHVDQTLSGTTPVHFALLPGSHLISVEAPGYVTRAQYLELPEHASSTTRLRVNLDSTEPAIAAAATTTEVTLAEPSLTGLSLESQALADTQADRSRDRTTRPSSLNYVLAATLFGIAVPLLANAVYGAVTHGDCVGQLDSRSRCSERVELGPVFFLSAGLGTAAALGGGAFLVFEPVAGPNTTPQGARLRLTQRF
jgi:hypothetical protein